MLAIVCPGQGSQTSGFLAPWLDLPGVADRLARLAEASNMDLASYGTTADEDTIKDTAVAQPLIVAAGVLAVHELWSDSGTAEAAAPVGVTAGHSVGEFTAAVVAGVLTGDQAVGLVKARGAAMAQASAVTPTGMSAVLGGKPDEVQEALDAHGLTPANNNGGGQIVAAGTMDQLGALAADPPARTRVISLRVAGAFHTHHMAPAVDVLAEHAERVEARDARIPLLSNRDGAVVSSSIEVLDRLVSQVSNPVRWDLCMEQLAAMGVTGLIELPPAGTLIGLAKRGLKGVETLALKSPDDLDKARAMLREHAQSNPASDA